MPLMTWNDNLSVGVKTLDDDHKNLVQMVNTLYDGMAAGQGRDALGKILDGLVTYTKAHFALEEQYFARTGYALGAAHKKEHDDLTSQVVSIQTKYNNGGTFTLTLDTLAFLKDWLVKHIQGSDKKYTAHFNAQGIR